jgi:hypothetical protein
MQLLSLSCRETCLFTEPLPGNDCCIICTSRNHFQKVSIIFCWDVLSPFSIAKLFAFEGVRVMENKGSRNWQ